MPYAVTHFLATAAVMKLTRLRLDGTRLLTYRELFLCAFIGLLPDLDMVVQVFSVNVLNTPFWPHRTFTHNLIIPLVLLFIGLLLYRRDVNRHAATIFFLAGAAWAVHVLLDYSLYGPTRLLAPISWSAIGYSARGLSYMRNLLLGLDGALLMGWLYLRSRSKNL